MAAKGDAAKADLWVDFGWTERAGRGTMLICSEDKK